MYSDGRPRRLLQQQQVKQQQQANQRKGFFFDGQRWVPQECPPVRPAPSGPVVFDIGGDDTDDEGFVDGGATPQAAAAARLPGELLTAADRPLKAAPSAATRAAARKAEEAVSAAGLGGLLTGRPKVAAVAFASLVAVALLSCAQAGLLAGRLPSPDDAAVARRAAHPRTDDAVAPALVSWRGLVPTCTGERFRVGQRLVKIRETSDKESRELVRLPPGSLAERTGPCENHGGLVRMPVRTAAGAADVHGWATLTAEFVQGPRFFEPVDVAA